MRAVTIARTWDETPGLRAILLDVGPAATSHAHAGQFVRLECEAGAGWFALASRPGERWELLVRRGPKLAEFVSALAVDAIVRVSDAQGAGYPLHLAKRHDLLLIAAGSGIAPIRSAALEVRARRRDFKKVTLVYGEKHPHDLAYARDLATWEQDGIAVHRVLSRAPKAWTGQRGYVQQALLHEAIAPSAHAFVTGMPSMMHAVTETLLSRGLAPDRIHRNA